jgi:rhodanese-related sulfurtransferase/DNA-binding transcriptional ArsR family regulator
MPIPTRRFKDSVYEQQARIAKATAAPKRLELLDLLCQGPRTVEALASQASLSVANTSQHLQVLRAARLVETEKKGLYVEYRLADEGVARFFVSLRELAEARLAEIDQVTRMYLGGSDGLEPVDGGELLERAGRGEVTVLDVRPKQEFDAGHLSGAVSIPVGELSERLAELPRDREVVAYCRGPYCVMALEAVQLLREQGFSARRWEQGVADFRAHGWSIETENQGVNA